MPTYTSGLVIKINTYGGTIKPAGFSERLGKAKHFPEQQYDKEGDKNTFSESRRA